MIDVGTVSPALCPNSNIALVWIDVAPVSHIMIDVGTVSSALD
jgi:hypothetical protein